MWALVSALDKRNYLADHFDHVRLAQGADVPDTTRIDVYAFLPCKTISVDDYQVPVHHLQVIKEVDLSHQQLTSSGYPQLRIRVDVSVIMGSKKDAMLK